MCVYVCVGRSEVRIFSACLKELSLVFMRHLLRNANVKRLTNVKGCFSIIAYYRQTHSQNAQITHKARACE